MLGELNVNKKSLSKSILYDSDWECGRLYDFFGLLYIGILS